MEYIFKEIVIFFTGASVLVSALVVLGKYLIKHLLSKDLEKFKANVSLEMEKYKSQLEKENIKHKIQFSKLHADRAEIIKEIYLKINIVEKSMSKFVYSLKKNDEFKEKGRFMAEKYREYEDYYKKNKIFFKTAQCQLMKEMGDTFQKFWPTDLSERSMNDRKDFWIKEKPVISKQVSLLKEKLEDDFRNMLGVDSANLVD